MPTHRQAPPKDGLSTLPTFQRVGQLRLLTVPLALVAGLGACDSGSTATFPTVGGSSGSASSGGNTSTAGSAGVSSTAGSSSSAGTSSSGGTGGTGGSGGNAGSFGSGGIPTVETVECTGDFPKDDVGSATFKVTAGGTSLGPLPHFWTTFGLGRMGLYLDQSMLADSFKGQDKENFDKVKWSKVLRDQTADAVKTLGLTSVRGHGLFHDDIGIYKADGTYDFSRSDNIFDFLVANKIAPIVELASMPSALAADPSQTVFDWKMIVSPPKDYDKWQALVQAFVQHSVDRYTADVVNTWYFEVWNEPECCSNKFWKGSLDDYFKLYDKSAAGVRAVLPNGRMGGPVSSQAGELSGGSMAGVQFLDHVKNTSAPLGFFAFHTWNFLDGAVGGYFDALGLLDSYGHTSVPIAVTEFGPTWEFGLTGASDEPAWEPQETAQGAAFVAQTYADIAQRCAKEGKRFPAAYAWWTLSDVFDEGFSDSGDYAAEANPFIGAMGLLGRESIKKPAFNVYKFLGAMGDEQLSLAVDGPGHVGGMAARDRKDGGVQVILYNGQNPGGGYRDDKYYEVGEAKNIGITVSGLNPELTYDVTAYRVDDVRGNSFAAWQKLGKKKMADMSAGDWEMLRGAMDSPAEEVGRAMCGTTFSKSFSLASPGVLFLTLEPAVALPK